MQEILIVALAFLVRSHEGRPLDNEHDANSPIPPVVIVDKECNTLCGFLFWKNVGTCQFDGSCLCWWGWTGPNARYIDYGPFAGRIQADYCMQPCHYTKSYRNTLCTSHQISEVQASQDLNEATTRSTTSTVSVTTATSTPPKRATSTKAVSMTPETKKARNNTNSNHVTKPSKSQCHPSCGDSIWHSAGKCQPNGRCLCWWGWTGPNAVYIDSGSLKNMILADYCTKPCHFTHDYRNPFCVGKKTTTLATITPPKIKECHSMCGISIWHAAGKCQPDGRCLCWWGWTGPNAKYIDGGEFNNRILADYCIKPCHFTHDFRNPWCASQSNHKLTTSSSVQTTSPVSTLPSNISSSLSQLNSTESSVTLSTTNTTPLDSANSTDSCSSQCIFPSGECRPDGQCLCWWGHTGPNAFYVVENGSLYNRIIADHCLGECYYTESYRNPECIIPNKITQNTSSSTLAPANLTTMNSSIATPTERTLLNITSSGNSSLCHRMCGYSIWHDIGKCQPDGRCLCWWGWTGPNATYIDGGELNNRILADYCTEPCHFTHDYRNPKCATTVQTPEMTTTESAITTTNSETRSTESQTTTDTLPQTTVGSTTSQYTTPPSTTPTTVIIQTPGDTEGNFTTSTATVQSNATSNSSLCHRLCGYSVWHEAGKCQPDGRCLCWWGWTGPNATYIDGGELNNRILADYCVESCHFTHDYRNPECVQSVNTTEAIPVSTTTASETTPETPVSTTNEDTIQQATNITCDNRCIFPSGECRDNGQCLCFWGHTGPNASYITENGTLFNRIIADHCLEECYQTIDFRNPECVADNTTMQTTVETTHSTTATEITTNIPPETPQNTTNCHPLCGHSVWHAAGECQENGRCLCWWGWTGPNAEYQSSNSNRIIADYCLHACDYTHDYRNPWCATSSETKDKTTTPSYYATNNSKNIVNANNSSPNIAASPPISSNDSDVQAMTSQLTSNTSIPSSNQTSLPHSNDSDVQAMSSQMTSNTSIALSNQTTAKAGPQCDLRCGFLFLSKAGTCQPSGRCLCWWGWTGPNAKYINGGSLNNRILADYCIMPCHFTRDFRNPFCAETVPGTTQDLTTESPANNTLASTHTTTLTVTTPTIQTTYPTTTAEAKTTVAATTKTYSTTTPPLTTIANTSSSVTP